MCKDTVGKDQTAYRGILGYSLLDLGTRTTAATRMLRHGVRVALGTDGCPSGGTHDVLETARVATLLARAQAQDPAALAPAHVLGMATSGGTHLFGAGYPTGIVPGARADIVTFDLHRVRSAAVHRPQSALVFQVPSQDAHTVIVDGNIVVDSGDVLMVNEQRLLRECAAAAASLRSRVGLLRHTERPVVGRRAS